MPFEFDPAKDAANVAKHGLSLGEFDGFDAEPVVLVDDRYDYGETRYQAFGRIDGKGHCLVYMIRDGELRPISFRRAHEKEMRRYE
jgi:uncharacterized DUF497 family protein